MTPARAITSVTAAAAIATVGAGAGSVQSPPFDASRVIPFADSFTTLIQGQARGWHRYGLERTSDGFRYSEAFEIPGAMDRRVEARLTPQLRAVSAVGSGTQFGQQIGFEIRYDGLRASGWSQAYSKAGPRRVTIDTTVPFGALDGNVLMGLLPALEWRLGANYQLTIFDVDEQSITTQALRVVGIERLAVPAGTFEVFRAELTTTQAPVRLWYTRAQPHRLIRSGDATEAFVTVLVSSSAN